MNHTRKQPRRPWLDKQTCEAMGKVWIPSYHKDDGTLVHGFCRNSKHTDQIKNQNSIKLTEIQEEILDEYLMESEDAVEEDLLKNIKWIIKNLKSGIPAPVKKEELNEFYDDVILYCRIADDTADKEDEKRYKNMLVSIEKLKKESETE
jgi:hypothetical protein